MSYLAIVRVENKKVAKFAEFENSTHASDHVLQYGGFVYNNLNGHDVSWLKVLDGNIVIVEDPVDRHAVKQVAVIAERTRRLHLGFEYDFGNGRGVHRIGTTQADMEGWRDVMDYANALIATGDTTTTIDIVTDTGPAAVTAMEWQNVMLRAAEVRQSIWTSSFMLQAMDPIPDDYQNDKYWISNVD